MAGTSIIFDLIGRDRASDKFDKVGDSADRSGGKMAKFGKVAKLAALGLAAGVGAAAVGIFKLTQGAAEDAAGQAKLAKAMQNAAGASKQQVAATEDWITAQGKALGVADDQLRPALQKLVGATGDVGKAQKLASLAMDTSAGTGMSLEAVSKALAKAQNGQVAGLSKLGISTKDAEGKVISFREAQRRLSALHNGQAATSANTLEGKMGRLKLMLAETGETIGSKFLPVGLKLADWFLRSGVPAMTRFGDYLGKTLPPIFTKVRAVVSTVMGALKGDIGGNLNGVKEIFRNTVSIIRSLWNAFGSNILQYARSTFTNIRTVIRGAFTVIRGIFKTVSALLKGDWKGVWDGIKTILRGAWTLIKGLVRQGFNVIRFAFKNFGVIAKALFRAAWTGIKTVAQLGVQWVITQVTQMPNRIKALGGLMLSAGKALISKLWEGVKSVAGNAGGFVADLVGKIKSGINNMLNLPLNFKLPKVLGGSTLTIIPRFEHGTNFAPGGVALVGEAGPELVDLPRGSKVTPHGPSMARLGAGGGGDERPIIVQLQLDGKTVEQLLIKRTRDTGRPLQVVTL